MIKAWRKQFETEQQQNEFDQFFKEFERLCGTFPEKLRQTQGPINQFVMGQIILLRNEIKQLKKELEQNGQRSID